MEENKGYNKKKRNGNVRCNASGKGLYSRFINQAKRNGVKNTPNISFDDLTEERKKEWHNIIIQATQEEHPLDSFPSAEEAAEFRVKFYNVVADQIKFRRIHRMVLEALEEMYNQQSVDNTWNWKNGNNGDEYESQGRVYTNPTELARYMWGEANPKNVMQVIGALNELSSKNVYLSRKEKREDRVVHTVLKVTLITTLGTSCVSMKNGKVKRVFSFIQLHPIFFEGITKNYFRHRNDSYSKVRDFYNKEREKSDKCKQKFMLPPDEPFYLLHYLSDFTSRKNYNPPINEDTFVRELNIKEFEQRRISRGRKKIENALNALKDAGAIKEWNSAIGKEGQRRYDLILDPDYFEGKAEDSPDK